MLGPPDGRYLVRDDDGSPRLVIGIQTLGAPERRRLGGKRPRKAAAADPEPVPTSRVTVIGAEPDAAAAEWLEGLDAAALWAEVDEAVRDLNGVLRAQRAAAFDPALRDVRAEQAIAVRVGHGSGDEVAEGRYADARVLPVGPRGRERTEPGERLAALLSGRDRLMACEELVLRARADIDAGRPREAALQTRVALEAFLMEMRDHVHHADRGDLEELRGDIGKAANAALHDDPPEPLQEAVEAAVTAMEKELRRRPVPPS